MQIVVGQPFSAFWDPIAPLEIGECALCRQKNSTHWQKNHSMIVGGKQLTHLQGDLCSKCLNFHPNADSKQKMDAAELRGLMNWQRQQSRNTEDIKARWQARKLRRCVKCGQNTTPKKI